MLYWENRNYKTEVNIGIWIGVSHQVGSALFYCFLTEKVNIVARTTVQHVTRDEAENPEIQQSTRNYHMTLASVIGADEFMFDINGRDAFINEEVTS